MDISPLLGNYTPIYTGGVQPPPMTQSPPLDFDLSPNTDTLVPTQTPSPPLLSPPLLQLPLLSPPLLQPPPDHPVSISLLHLTATLSTVPNPSDVRPSVPALKPGFVDIGGPTSFAQRHPLKDVQPPRFRVHQSQSDAAKLLQGERKLRRAEKTQQLHDGVAAIVEQRDKAINSLAERLSTSKDTIRSLINNQTHYMKKRAPNTFNALVHKAQEEMKNDLDSGDQPLKLKGIQDIIRQGMDNGAFSSTYTRQAVQELEESREVKERGSRSSNTVAYADARATTASLSDEIISLGMRTGVTGLALFTKGHVHDPFIDTLVEFNNSANFFPEVLNITPGELVSKFQQWVCSRKQSLDAPDNLQTAQNACASLIKNGLRVITNITNLAMNYVNYHTSIQQKHHVELLGWPSDIPFTNPHQITTVAVARKLQNVLYVGTCKWVTMTKRQVQEHSAELAWEIDGGDVVGKKRKPQSDKGKKWKHTATTNVSDDDDDDDGDTAVPPVKKTKKAPGSATASAVKKAKRIANMLPPAPPKSKEVIDTEDDESDN